MMNTKRRFQPVVEGCERRLAMSATPAMAPLAALAAPGVHASAIHASSVTQAVIELYNASSITVGYEFRWNSSSSWSTGTIAPNTYKYFWANSSSSLSPQVQFDQSTLAGWQGKTYNLSYFNYVGNGGTPPVAAAKFYQFQNVTGGVDLYSITTQSVTGFKNSSNITVAFQFRWNSGASWSSTVYLAPGQNYYYWTSPPNASSPQVQFDQSVLPGWQTKSYSLSWNRYIGGNTPPLSTARLYTFQTVVGGVDLYG